MRSIDINCDLGEGKLNDASLMPCISSANICCGYHAGDEKITRATIKLALKNKVAIGAHPGFADKENFGRVELILPSHDYYALVMEQLILFKNIAAEEGATIHHVKAHGALYNLASKNVMVANELAKAVYDFDPNLIFYGLSNSNMLFIAETMGLRTASEVFADRTYEDDGSLTPRVKKNSVLTDPASVAKQALLLASEKQVMSTTGKSISVKADTICIHGDSPNAPGLAKAIHQRLKENKIEIRAL
jgi:UPF0271 protein